MSDITWASTEMGYIVQSGNDLGHWPWSLASVIGLGHWPRSLTCVTNQGAHHFPSFSGLDLDFHGMTVYFLFFYLIHECMVKVEAQNQVVRKLEEKERLLQNNLAAVEKELTLR